MFKNRNSFHKGLMAAILQWECWNEGQIRNPERDSKASLRGILLEGGLLVSFQLLSPKIITQKLY